MGMDSTTNRRESLREEMNLIEIPLAMLSARDKRKTVEISDTISDASSGQRIERKWIVTGADKWGLPHGSDADICLALQKLTLEKNRLDDGVVPFSLYELRNQLGWSHGGYSNDRLKEGLERILGVSIECINSWRKNNRWASLDAFHVLERLCLSNTVAKFDAEEEQRIKWNEVVLQSMKSGNLKKLDWDFYLGLESAVTKRLYRFLNKRFGIGDRFTYDVVPFCENKMGMWQQRKTNYRQTLMVGIDELMRKGVLPRTSEEQLFSGRGKHQRVVFNKPKRQTPKPQVARQQQTQPSALPVASKPIPDGIEGKLVRLGVQRGSKTETSASSLVGKYPAAKIERCISHFERLNADLPETEKKGVGFLIASIRSDEETGFVPVDFKTADELEQEKKLRAAASRARERCEKAQRVIDEKYRALPEESFALLSPDIQRELECEAKVPDSKVPHFAGFRKTALAQLFNRKRKARKVAQDNNEEFVCSVAVASWLDEAGELWRSYRQTKEWAAYANARSNLDAANKAINKPK